ncbi:MAG: AmmeMemoRadiSam system protein A [Verrucomicrobia bacterium]|nr:AmmeMemoRadiSam system protein A [Verrucomicrobiota bacterium]MCG2681709.1 AmmeMemoRadiSam system protein A [Kiritimatiellia bacterium]MBU4248524.1 AmmeMemoRadiSam system protein A [Verrucomicrobiota bacterium]MBU4290197.1 AmmeMemoRadiSam system protein A [Verrucomicrobiota bacterium]MBU4428225.1 AmmeMemoRadiSam system protein A [Verrucomicrobiota bacterium]
MKAIHIKIIVGLCLAWSMTGAWGDSGAGSNVSAAQTGATVPASISKEVKMKEHKSGTWTPGLSDEEKQTLFTIAKDTLDWCVSKKKSPFPMESYKLTPKLKVPMATFVTLKIKGDLRGCIGSLAPVEALYLSVHHNAINAAMEDFRFSPVQPVELPRLEIDVSILSPIRNITSLDEFKLGQMGIILEKGMRRAVFLPEVAVEQGWTKEKTLSHLSQKAGLPPDAWQKDARFQVFESVVLSLDEVTN